jgi:peptidoglycan/LPS O-acetylase OafA/YrhL
VGLAAAAFGGWLITSREFYVGPLFQLIIGFFFGTGIGEIVLRVTGRKRGTTMEILAGSVVVSGLIIGHVINYLINGLPPSATFMSMFLLNPMSLIMYGVSAFGAVNRVKFL